MFDGCFLGFAVGSDNAWIGTTDGAVVKARTFKRLAPGQDFDGALLDNVKGVPWKPVPEGARVPKVYLDGSTEVDEKDLPPKTPGLRETSAHRVHIRRAVELRKYGFIDGCAGCIAARLGDDAVAHTEACRTRIEAEMQNDEEVKARVAEAEQRRHDADE